MPVAQPRPMYVCPHCLGLIKWYTDLTCYQTVIECAQKPDEHIRITYSTELSEMYQQDLFREWEHELVMVGLTELLGCSPYQETPS